MKKIILFLGFFSMVLFPCQLSAQDCEVPMGVVLPAQAEDIPDIAENYLVDKLRQMATTNGIGVDMAADQFCLSAKVNLLDKNILPGPPMQHSYTLSVSLYVVDNYNKKIFSSTNLEVKGVGTNENKAYISAIRRINVKSADIQLFIDKGKQKIIQYYDDNYQKLMAKADAESTLKRYGEALHLVMTIPPCSKGYAAALKNAGRYYQAYADQSCQENLAKARAAWNTQQDAIGAAKAGEFLSQIYPDAACYGDAMNLYKDIKAQVKENIKFEMKQYNDEVALEKQRIEMMKAIGVAYGQGPKESKRDSEPVKIYWLK